MSDLPYESLPQRQARSQRRRRGANSEAAVAPVDDHGGVHEEGPSVPAVAAAARALPGASTSSPEGQPLHNIDIPEYRTCAVGTSKYECERLHLPSSTRVTVTCQLFVPWGLSHASSLRLPLTHLLADLDHTADVQLHACASQSNCCAAAARYQPTHGLYLRSANECHT